MDSLAPPTILVKKSSFNLDTSILSPRFQLSSKLKSKPSSSLINIFQPLLETSRRVIDAKRKSQFSISKSQVEEALSSFNTSNPYLKKKLRMLKSNVKKLRRVPQSKKGALSPPLFEVELSKLNRLRKLEALHRSIEANPPRRAKKAPIVDNLPSLKNLPSFSELSSRMRSIFTTKRGYSQSIDKDFMPREKELSVDMHIKRQKRSARNLA